MINISEHIFMTVIYLTLVKKLIFVKFLEIINNCDLTGLVSLFECGLCGHFYAILVHSNNLHVIK